MSIKVGEVTHFFSNISVAIIKLEKPLKAGTKVKFKGYTTDFEEVLDEMQYDHKNIEEGAAGQEVGVKVSEKVRVGDDVFLKE